MERDTVIITVNLYERKYTQDLEVPLDISANELCSVMEELYHPEMKKQYKLHYLRSERPIALLKGERTLRDYGIRDGSIINIEG